MAKVAGAAGKCRMWVLEPNKLIAEALSDLLIVDCTYDQAPVLTASLLQPQLFWTVISPFHSPKKLFWLLSRSATH